MLEYTLMEFPQYREECWRSVLSPDAARFHCYFTMLARSLFDPGNEISGNLFFRHGGLIHLTDAMRLADQGTVTNENEFYNVEALSLLCDYLTRMHVCHNTPCKRLDDRHFTRSLVLPVLVMWFLVYTYTLTHTLSSLF